MITGGVAAGEDEGDALPPQPTRFSDTDMTKIQDRATMNFVLRTIDKLCASRLKRRSAHFSSIAGLVLALHIGRSDVANESAAVAFAWCNPAWFGAPNKRSDSHQRRALGPIR